MFHMKTASVRELRQDFPRLLDWLESGEEVSITLRRKPVAMLVPLERKKGRKQAWPDVAVRLRKVFGDRTIPNGAIQEIIDFDRGRF